MGEKWSTEGVPGGHNPPGRARHAWHSLMSCAHQGTLPGSFFISKILKYSKTDENIFVDFSESVYLPYHVPPYFHFWSVPTGLFYVFFRCQSLDNITFNINGRT